ncbi:MAG: iron-only hydrogenase system regulator [Oscillospiraceae bacterium]|nr:iron-only hydrogenase system regulator [Oscillospiraceae bacterium]
MESRIAAVSILVEGPDSVETLNAILHDYAPYILGRLGIPYREKELSVICLVLDAPMDTINALTGKLGRLPGVSAKAVTPRSAK